MEHAHANKYRIFNWYPEVKYDKAFFRCAFKEYPCDIFKPPPLHLLLAFVKDITEWLDQKSTNVAVVHCQDGIGLLN